MTREPLAVMAKPPVAPLQVVLIGTYPPRQCGIATFTRDLAEAVATPAPGGWPAAVGFARRARPTFDVSVVAIDSERRDFPPEVRRRLDPDRPGDYLAVADWLNHASIDAVSLQHEFGIYGGPDGERILALAGELDVPLVTTFHTVLQRPSPNQRRVVRTLAGRSTRVVVLSHGAARTLREVYALDPARIAVVPHGVPDLPLVDPERVKPLVGLSGRPVVLSFGLLGPGKGYELAIRAMADVIRAEPAACYVILGATHPDLRRREGEAYRSSLKALVAELELHDHVRFVDAFVDAPTLGRWLQASDVFVTPYPGVEQAVSGTLAYALGTGKALVSTPYAYARELLADGRGRLVPFGDSAALAREISAFLTDQSARDEARIRAYRYGRQMIWPTVGAAYRELVAQARGARSGLDWGSDRQSGLSAVAATGVPTSARGEREVPSLG